MTENGDSAGAWNQQTEQHGDGRGFPGAVAAEQAKRRSGLRGEADAVHRSDVAVLFRKIVYLNDAHARPDTAVRDIRQEKFRHRSLAGARRRLWNIVCAERDIPRMRIMRSNNALEKFSACTSRLKMV
jgi:hypothetical protein